MLWIAKHPKATPEMLGYVPSIIIDDDPRSAKEQIADRYNHGGGGWSPFEGHIMLPNGNLQYPEDPPTRLLFEAILHKGQDNEEKLRFYEHAWIAVIQADGTFEISRID
jgi:hypothetical protein